VDGWLADAIEGQAVNAGIWQVRGIQDSRIRKNDTAGVGTTHEGSQGDKNRAYKSHRSDRTDIFQADMVMNIDNKGTNSCCRI
jgi:hypothetical protein